MLGGGLTRCEGFGWELPTPRCGTNMVVFPISMLMAPGPAWGMHPPNPLNFPGGWVPACAGMTRRLEDDGKETRGAGRFADLQSPWAAGESGWGAGA